MRGQARFASHVRGWLVAGGLGLLGGYLVGLGMTGAHTDARWPALAGLVLGVVGSLAAPTRQVLVASCGAGVAVVAAVAKIVAYQYQCGRWPITDEFTIAHYGTATQATMRAAVMLGVSLGVPCLVAAVLVTVARRRSSHGFRPVEDEVPEERRATQTRCPQRYGVRHFSPHARTKVEGRSLTECDADAG